MKFLIPFLFVWVFVANCLSAAPDPSTVSPFIHVDQFGYFPASKKVAVVSNPQVGYNSDQSFSPGVGRNEYELRRWDNDQIVFQGTLYAWGDGQVHEQSGDQGWWFDFSEVTEPGSYYVYDAKNKVGTGRFEISANVYDEVLKQAVRMFYYQRCNYPKEAPYAGEWTDEAAFEGPNQDSAATDVKDKGNPETARDLRGGWFDAGDLNKYVTFAFQPLVQMLQAYRLNPTVFKDDYNIPESGNGVPDLLDEIKYEMDWFIRMQDATGTGGLLLKMGVEEGAYEAISPPSEDPRPRYYLGECTASTIAGAGAFALGGLVYQSLPQDEWQAYGRALIERAERAWERAKVTTDTFTTLETNCDNGEVRAGDADRYDPEPTQKSDLVTAAVYLYEATGKLAYREYVEQKYAETQTFFKSPTFPFDGGNGFAMLYYTTLPEASSAVTEAITERTMTKNIVTSLDDYRAETDLYRAYMKDWAYVFGSNRVRADNGSNFLNFNTFNLNPADEVLHQEAAEQYAHWLHGVNPLGLVMLSNMYDYGAESSVNEIYHDWYLDGTRYDNAQTDIGPAPGYLTGGPNKDDEGVTLLSPPYGQPPQKAYRDWNTRGPDQKPYYYTEAGIAYQGPYVAFLSRLMAIGKRRATTPPVSGDAYTIYRDALAQGWRDQSWSCDVDYGESAVKQEGTAALRVLFQATGSAAVSLASERVLDAREYEAIELQAHGGNGAGQQLSCYVHTEDGTVSQSKSITVPAGTWQSVRVPLSELGNPSTVKRISLQNKSLDPPTSFYLDDIKLVKPTAQPSFSPLSSAELRAYPNELGEDDALHLRWGQAGERRIEVMDLQGQVVYQTVQRGTQFQIDRRHFRQTGIYIVRVFSPDENPSVEALRVFVR